MLTKKVKKRASLLSISLIISFLAIFVILQSLKNNILVASRGPRGGYRLARERRKIKILDIIKSVTTEKEVSELYKSKISKIIIQPLINKFLEESMVYLNKISVEDIYNQYKQKNKDNSNKKVDFVI